MNDLLRRFEKESGLEIFGLGARRSVWEAAMTKYAELIVQECIDAVDKTNTHHVHTTFDDSMVRGTMAKTKVAIREHFGVES